MQHKGQNKSGLLTQGDYCSLCPWQSQNKWPQAYRCDRFTFLAHSHLHYHHLSCAVWQPNILFSVCFVYHVCASQNKGKWDPHISVHGPPHRFDAFNSSKQQQLWNVVQLREFAVSSSCSHLCTSLVSGLNVIYYFFCSCMCLII